MGLHISINTASASTANSSIDNAISFIAAHAAMEKQQGRIPGGPALDITFLLPGIYEEPPFVGMRMGGYTEGGGTLYFETAVPRHMLDSEQAPHYVALVMQDVVEHAHEYFLENQIPFDVQSWRSTMSKLTKSDIQFEQAH